MGLLQQVGCFWKYFDKLRLIMKGYNQQEGIDFDETYVSIAKLEVIRMFLAFSCLMNFKLSQMDVKSVFLNSYI